MVLCTRYEAGLAKRVASLMLPTAFAFGAEILAEFELAEVGVSRANWSDGDFSFLTSLVMMAVDAVLYSALALYLDQVTFKVELYLLLDKVQSSKVQSSNLQGRAVLTPDVHIYVCTCVLAHALAYTLM